MKSQVHSLRHFEWSSQHYSFSGRRACGMRKLIGFFFHEQTDENWANKRAKIVYHGSCTVRHYLSNFLETLWKTNSLVWPLQFLSMPTPVFLDLCCGFVRLPAHINIPWSVDEVQTTAIYFACTQSTIQCRNVYHWHTSCIKFQQMSDFPV